MPPIYTGTIKPMPPAADGRLSAPSAARNLEPILGVLRDYMPASGQAVEIASGTGQHCAAFAEAFPDVRWQPTDVELDRLASIDGWSVAAGLQNMAPAVALNVEQAEWPFGEGSADVMILVNMLHLVSASAAASAFAGAASLIRPGGRFFVYGPFRRDGAFVSESDESFHDSLVLQNSTIGYKDMNDIAALAKQSGFSVLERREMPANNLMFAMKKG